MLGLRNWGKKKFNVLVGGKEDYDKDIVFFFLEYKKGY